MRSLVKDKTALISSCSLYLSWAHASPQSPHYTSLVLTGHDGRRQLKTDGENNHWTGALDKNEMIDWPGI